VPFPPLIADPRFRRPSPTSSIAERQAVDEEIEVLTTLGPFRREVREEQD
jgi:hypothetical protein